MRALDLTTIEPLRLRQAHDSADLVKSRISLRTERREDITQIDGILGITVEVGTRKKSHCPLSRAHSRGAANEPLFDHLVGQREQGGWDCKAECFGGLQVDEKVELIRQHYG
jgi:hypothetical protein